MEFSTKDLLDTVKKYERKNRRRNLWILSVAIALGLIFLVTSVFHIRKGNEELAIESRAKDSIQSVASVYIEKFSKEDSAKFVVAHFLTAKNRGNLDSMAFYLADTLSRYYTLTAPTREKVLSTDSAFFKNRPSQSFKFSNGIAVSSTDSNHISVMVAGDYASDNGRPKETIQVLKLNSDYRVVSVRAFFP